MLTKRYVLLLPCILALTSFTDKSGKNRDCSSVKNGKFKMENPEFGVCIIERMGNTQIETLEKFGQKGVFDVVWIDDCTYSLRVRKILRNDIEMPIADTMEVKARIMEVTDSSYVIETTSNIAAYAVRFELLKVKE